MARGSKGGTWTRGTYSKRYNKGGYNIQGSCHPAEGYIVDESRGVGICVGIRGQDRGIKLPNLGKIF